MTTINILIPDGHTKNVLAAVRTLGQAGHHITLGLTREPRTTRMFSRYINSTVKISDPKNNPQEYIDSIKRIEKDHDVLLPFTHEKTIPISQHLEELSIATPTPPYDILKYGHDKKLTIHTCQKLNIPTPRTWQTPDDPEIEYPVVIKARKNCGVQQGLRYARNREELEKAYREIENQPDIEGISEYKNPLIQEYVKGQIHDVVGIYQNGKCKAAIAQKRIETIPPTGGPGAYNKTILDRKLVKQSTTLLDHIDWHGPYQTEWILDPRDNKYKIIELNPKMWGTLELAIRSGVNIPEMTVRIALKEEIEPVRHYDIGTKKFWPLSTLQNTKREPNIRRMIMSCWVLELIDLKDPKPDIYDITSTLRKLLK